MNAIAQTIKASQDAEAARKAASTAKEAMQREIFADARDRVAKLIKDFNATPMELQAIPNGPPGSLQYPLYTSWGVGREYSRLGKGLRFFLLWAHDGRTLCLALNAVCRYATEYAVATGKDSRESRTLFEMSSDLMSASEAQECLRCHGALSSSSDRNYRVVGHITRDGQFARGSVSYDDKELPEFICKSAVDWMTYIVAGCDVAPFVVLQPKKGKKTC